MKYVVNSKQMKAIDESTISAFHITQPVLMERAALQVVAVMKQYIKKEDHILAVCGPGNNGGDGVAAGRILYLQGYHVALLFVGEVEKATDGFKTQLQIAQNLGVPIEHSNKLSEYNIIIDAIFGVGLSRPVANEYENIIKEINETNHTVYAVDIPSGISADNGKVMNIAIRADYTVTFGYQKMGLLLYPGAEYAGEVTVADIGFPEVAAINAEVNTMHFEHLDLSLLPVRSNYSNKGTYGKVLVIAGRKGMSGAAYLSAKAAYRTGSGMVKVLTSEENRIIIQTSLPEALFAAYDDSTIAEEARYQNIISDMNWADVIIFGPGLGVSETSAKLLDIVIDNRKVPLIIDADGINLLAARLDSKLETTQTDAELDQQAWRLWKNRLECLSVLLKDQIILTPHLMELSRLLRLPISEIVNNLVDTVFQCSYNNNLIYAIKDARTIVAKSNQRYINISGNNGMATAGSGDVLTGIIAALIAQGMDSYEATCLAVYIHGLAGDEAAKRKGTYSLMASDIVDHIETVLLMAQDISNVIH